MGVIINSNLTWHDHIKAISSKVSKSIGILLRIRKNVPNDVLLTLYHMLIEPYFSYCNIIRGTHCSKYLDQLYRKQKKAVRIIANAKWNAHTDPLFLDFQLLFIFNRNKLQTCCFIYTISNCLLPTVFQNLFTMFTLNSNVHDHKTRQSFKLHVISHRTNSRAYSIQIYGVRLWNMLSKDITEVSLLSIFK